jgi:endonuclease-8
MPEGDTIHRSARTLHAVLAGRRLTRFETPRLVSRGPAPGTRVTAVEARGKHLLIRFEDGSILHTHMRMTGSWHLYRRGEPWRRSPRSAVVVLEVDDATVAVCFAAPVVELWPARRAPGPNAVDALGPDLCLPDPPIDDVLARLARTDGRTEIAVALMDQRIASGVGNVYKSEVCFACRVEPGTPVGSVDDEGRRQLVTTAHRLLRANLDRAHRQTVPEGLAVYGRAGRPCRRCGRTIRRRLQGDPPRTTFWCPGCQRATEQEPTA